MPKESTPNLYGKPYKIRGENHRATKSNPLCKMGDYNLLLLKLQLEGNLLMHKNPPFTLLVEEKRKRYHFLTQKQEELTLALGLLFFFLYHSLCSFKMI